MDQSDSRGFIFLFSTKEEADTFVKNVRQIARTNLYISVADMKKLENPKHYRIDPDGEDFNLGYNISDVKSVNPTRYEATGQWAVIYPGAGKIVMNEKGLWQATNVGGA